MIFKQRFFSWFDSYDIYDDTGRLLFTVKGQLSWGHLLKIFDASGEHIGTVKEKIFTFLPKFEIYDGDTYIGCISKEFTFFKPKYNIDYNGWHIDGNWIEWNYKIIDIKRKTVAVISKEVFNFTDTYVIDVWNKDDMLPALMFVLAIDAEKCSRG